VPNSNTDFTLQGKYYDICDIIPEKWLNIVSENKEILFDTII
jgi:hypothetical protein